MKDHPFTDGNKRIGSLPFLLYLNQEGVAHRLNPQALTALTLLIAESASSGKDLMVRLVVNLLVERADERLRSCRAGLTIHLGSRRQIRDHQSAGIRDHP